MTCGYLILEQKLLGIFRQIEKTQSIRDGRTTFRHRLSYIGLCHLLPIHETLIAIRLFDRVQIRTLNILNERKL